MAAARILVVGPSWVGDMVMAQALFIALKQRRPAATIDVLAPAWSFPLLQRMPEVSSALTMPVGHGRLALGERWRLGRELRGRYDQAILLPNSFKSALVPFFARIPLRTGWRGELRYGLLNDVRNLDEQRYPRMVERFVALADAAESATAPGIPIPRLRADGERLAALLAQFELDRERPVLALCPGAEFGPAKRWPERHYAAVAAAMIARGWQVWLFGSANDRAVAQAIVQALPAPVQAQVRVLAGLTALAEAIDLLAAADAVVSNDSGLMHIAAALDRPLVAVYGSTSPAFTPPLGERVASLSIPVDCGPCFQRECPLQHLRCLTDLGPGQVLAALAELAPAVGRWS